MLEHLFMPYLLEYLMAIECSIRVVDQNSHCLVRATDRGG